MSKGDCERLANLAKSDIHQAYVKKEEVFERLLKEKDLQLWQRNETQTKAEEAFERLLKGTEWHVEDLQHDKADMKKCVFLVCFVFVVVMISLAVLNLHATKSRNEQKQALNAQISKYEAVLQEKVKRIQELEKKLEKQQQRETTATQRPEVTMLHAQHIPQQPFVYALPASAGLPGTSYKG